MAKFRVTLSIGYSNASREEVIEIDDGELEACTTEQEREKLMNEHWQDWANNFIDGSIEPMEGEE